MLRRKLLAAALGLAAGLALSPFPAAAPAHAQDGDPIKIGDLNSYTSLPAFTLPYKKGWQLALEEINRAGGVMGRPLEVISRDDGGSPGDAQTVANELVRREGVVMLVGTILSHVGLAVSDYAAQADVPFLAAEPLTDAIAWSKGNDVTFRLRPGTYVQAAMLAEEAAKLDVTRWATVAPNYEYGQSAVAAFKTLLKERRPDVEFVEEQWPALFKIDAGATVQALARAEPEAIFNVTFGTDLVKFVREGSLRGLFENREVVSLLTGEPEWMNPLGEEVPVGWIVTGYPWYDLDTPEHLAFLKDYRERFGEPPRMGSVVGYVSLHAIAKAIGKAESTETAAITEAMRGMALDTPFGPIVFRRVDQQSTMGTFVGRTIRREGEAGAPGGMEDWRYAPGHAYLPSQEEVKAWRPEG
ncbi:MAG: ABC transporter substrate-binding protein [Rhodovibrionaceae bacterium]|nr:ABC transporter substrate-binding protein [Rhodovibrionaceae bacterium]